MGDVVSSASRTVRDKSDAVLEMSRRRDLLRDLLLGTLGMRDKGEKWLPPAPKEDADAFKKRLERSILFNGFADTVQRKLPTKPFSRLIDIVGKDAIKAPFADIFTNADGAGSSLHEVGREAFVDAATFGLSHFLVDLPPEAPRNRADQLQPGMHPKVVNVFADQILGWKERTTPFGKELKQVRILEAHAKQEGGGNFDEETEEVVRVFNAPGDDGSPGTWELHHEQKSTSGGKEWVKFKGGVYTAKRIPIFTFYAHKTGFMRALPPLEALAWTNLEHWQVSSDSSNHLAYAMIAIYNAAGYAEDEIERLKADGLGWGTIARSRNVDASLGLVEHSGKAIEAGAARLEKLEKQMEVLGLQPFVERRSDATATGVASNDSGTSSMMQEWCADESQTLTDAVKLAAELFKETLPKEFAVKIFRDFVVPTGATDDGPLLLQAQAATILDRKTTALELQRRGKISEDVDIDAMLAKAKTEMVPDPSVPGFDTGDDDEEEPELDDDGNPIEDPEKKKPGAKPFPAKVPA